MLYEKAQSGTSFNSIQFHWTFISLLQYVERTHKCLSWVSFGVSKHAQKGVDTPNYVYSSEGRSVLCKKSIASPCIMWGTLRSCAPFSAQRTAIVQWSTCTSFLRVWHHMQWVFIIRGGVLVNCIKRFCGYFAFDVHSSIPTLSQKWWKMLWMTVQLSIWTTHRKYQPQNSQSKLIILKSDVLYSSANKWDCPLHCLLFV